MRGRQAAVAACLWSLLSSTALAQIAPVPGGIRADGLAAIVGGSAPGPDSEVILQSDVELRARIHLAGQGSGSLPTGPVSDGLLRATLEELVGEVLIAREAQRVRIAEAEDAEVAEQMGRFERQAGGAQRLARLLRVLGASRAEMVAMARRRATVQAFLRANLEGTTVVTDAELEGIYEAGGHPFVGKPLEEVADGLRAWVARQALQRAVQRWVSVLRSRTQVRILAPYGEPSGE